MSDNFLVTRSTTIDAPASAVYERIVDLRRWRDWSPWEGLDPDLQRTYSETTAGAGATYSWSGNRKAGAGTMAITRAEPDRLVEIALGFLKPFKSQNTTTFELDGEGDSTTVTWTMTGPKTLMTKIMGLFTSMDKMVGPDFEKGLAQLKADTES